MLNKNTAYQMIDLIESQAKFYTTVMIDYKEEGLTRFANSQIHQNVYNQDTQIEISVTSNKRTASVSTNVCDEASIIEALRKAESILEFIPEGDIELPELQNEEAIEHSSYCETLNDAFSISKRAALLKEGIEKIGPEYIAAGSLTQNTYTLQAVPTGSMTGDACSTLTLTNTGLKGVGAGATLDATACWQR